MMQWILSSLFLLAWAAPHKTDLDFEVGQALRLPRTLAAQRLKPYGVQASLKLEEFAFNKKWPMKTRWKSLMTLVELQGKDAVSTIERAFTSSAWFMRSAGLTAIKDLDPSQARVWAYKAFSRDKALMVRMKAFEILKGSRNKKIRQLFWRKLFSQDNRMGKKSLWIRGDIARELLPQSGLSEAPQWARLLYDRDKELQIIATQALGRIRPSDAGQGGNNISFWRERFPKVKTR